MIESIHLLESSGGVLATTYSLAQLCFLLSPYRATEEEMPE
jgi:hypothetical protein